MAKRFGIDGFQFEVVENWPAEPVKGVAATVAVDSKGRAYVGVRNIPPGGGVANILPGVGHILVLNPDGTVADNWGDFAIHEQKPRFTMNEGYDPDLVVRKWREAYRRFYLYRPERVWEKMTFKENWTNLPGTFAQIRRFFIGTKDQASPEKVKGAA